MTAEGDNVMGNKNNLIAKKWLGHPKQQLKGLNCNLGNIQQ